MSEVKLMVGAGTGAESGTEAGLGMGTKSGARRGPKPKNQLREIDKIEEQRKFVADLSQEDEERRLIFEILKKANDKPQGREVTFKDLVLISMSKINEKDIAKLQELSLSKQEKLQKVVDEYNLKNGTSLSLEDYFMMKAGIN